MSGRLMKPSSIVADHSGDTFRSSWSCSDVIGEDAQLLPDCNRFEATSTGVDVHPDSVQGYVGRAGCSLSDDLKLLVICGRTQEIHHRPAAHDPQLRNRVELDVAEALHRSLAGVICGHHRGLNKPLAGSVHTAYGGVPIRGRLLSQADFEEHPGASFCGLFQLEHLELQSEIEIAAQPAFEKELRAGPFVRAQSRYLNSVLRQLCGAGKSRQ